MRYFASTALLQQGWCDDVLIETDTAGAIASIVPGSQRRADAELLRGPVVPGMPNLHSHAFQRAMAGLTESRGNPTDSFWTWRELMYRFAARITPEQMHAIASHLYVEMLKAGYTGVAEFHYVHHDEDGRPYADAAEMSHRVIDAARSAGIAITHLPVLYAHSGFGGQSPLAGQRRFVHDSDGYARLIGQLFARYRDSANVRLGVAFHSLRAVDPAMLAAGYEALQALDSTAPIHIHIAEQTKEVDDCIAWSGQRPVAWLLDHAPVDARWCLVHATHLDAGETRRVAASRAVAGLCPTTEANLGDGLFPAIDYLNAAGVMGIGSDSHISVGVSDELRMLEYGQRLAHRRRAVLATDEFPSTGRRLYEAALAGGAQALGIPAGRLEAGHRADWLVLDADHRVLWNKRADQLLDAWIFAGDAACVRDVMVGGEWRVRDRVHAQEEAIAARFRRVQAELLR